MTMAQPYMSYFLVGAVALAGMTGCAMDAEAKVRADVDRWVDIGATLYFDSRMSCTAGVFSLSSDEVKSTAVHAVTIREGLSILRRGETAKFQSNTLSPNDISAQVNSMDMSVGNGMIASGLAARDCLSDAWKDAYQAALVTQGATLIFQREDNTLVLVDHASRQVFFARGDV